MITPIAQSLRKQNLIAKKNNIQAQIMQNNLAQYNALNFGQSNPISFQGVQNAHAFDSQRLMQNCSNVAILNAINAELDASKPSINYLA